MGNTSSYNSLLLDVEDFLAETSMLTFAPGETKKCQPFDIIDDEVVEELLEDFAVEIDDVSPGAVGIGENSTTTVTIMDDDSTYSFAIRELYLINLFGWSTKIHWSAILLSIRS